MTTNAKRTKTCDILLENATFLNAEMKIERAGAVAIVEGRVAAITDAGEYTAKERLDGRGLLWMPGLTDGHTHTSQQFLRGRLLDEKPVIWKRINVPFESRLTPETSRLSAEVAALEMIRSGTTAFVDAGGKYAEAFAEVYRRSGLRCALTVMTTDSPAIPENLRTTPVEGPKRLARLLEAVGDDGLMRVFFSATALTACSLDLIHAVFEEAAARDVPVEIHMNEYAGEVFEFMERTGLRPFEYLEARGFLEKVPFVAPHCIFLSPNEVEIIARRGVRVAHCPFSNCGKGVPDTPQLLRNGVSVGFGSDGSAHGGLDLFREMRLFRGVMNATRGTATADPQVMPAEVLLKMATAGGAAGLLSPDGGVLREGAPADLIAIDVDRPHLFPTQNLVHTLVESATGGDVRHMIVNGRVLMKDRRVLTLDEEKILSEVRAKFGEIVG